MTVRMSWRSLGVRKPWYRRIVAAAIKWAMHEDLEELYAQDDMLHRHLSDNESAARRLDRDITFRRQLHDDWLKEMKAHAEKSDAILEEAKKQSAALDLIAKRMEDLA